MKKIILLSVTFSLLITATAFQSDLQTKASFQPVAVIELFTSQGSVSCPSADRLLTQTIKEAKKDGRKIFTFSFHVDYWNRLDRADPFNTKEYSLRQRAYAAQINNNSVYAPQMIVNGSRQFVSSNENDLKVALDKSLPIPPAATFKTFSANLQNNSPPQVKFSLNGNYAGCNINFVLVSLSETTFIKRGENGGLTFTNENVVRQFIATAATAEGIINFKALPVPAANNRAIIAYL